MCSANVSCAYLLGVDDLTFEDNEDDAQGGRGGSSDGEPGSGGKGGKGGTLSTGGTLSIGGGTAGTGSATGGTSGTSTGVNPTCQGHAGPLPVNIEGRFCIDSTEVTNAQYAQFLASGPPAPTDAACSWNFNYTPNGGWPAANPNLPVGYVDWCDARGYCAWAGKRLCGLIGGGQFDWLDFPANRLSTELYYVCSDGGALAFPYGNSYSPAACATDNLSSARPVGSSPGCEGGFPGVFDLSGNMVEWQDSCSNIIAMSDQCPAGSRGFSAFDTGNPPGAGFSCGADNPGPSRSTAYEDNDIRCCSDAI
jgi:formylglycine-generating enzyme required for sulfatase activity